MPVDIDDPRVFAQRIDPTHEPLVALAGAGFAAASLARAEEIHRALTGLVLQRLRSGESMLLAEAFAAAPSPEIARALWRALIAAWSPSWRAETGVAVTLFALPVVVVAGVQQDASEQT